MPPPTGAALDAALAAALAARKQRGTLRTLPPAEPTPGAALVDFTSNDYLSLSSSPSLRASFLRALAAAPADSTLGARGSRLLIPGGLHAALEARLAGFFGAPALLMNAGYDANAALFGAVPQPGDVLLADALVHASVHDGARAGRAAWDARTHVFAHNDVSSLEALCTRMKTRYPALVDGSASAFVAVEAVYSMDGTLAPLPEIVAALARAFPAANAHLVVDEAHASGVYGPRGAGLVAHHGLEDQVFARLCTFGKALAGSGAVLLVPERVKAYLANYARPLVYTTALAHPNVVLAACVFDVLEAGAAAPLAARVLVLAARLVARVRAGLHTIPPSVLALPKHLEGQAATPIVPLLTAHPRALAKHLAREGMDARAIAPPTVPRGQERVRVCVHAGHSEEEVDKLADACLAWARAWVGEGEERGVAKL